MGLLDRLLNQAIKSLASPKEKPYNKEQHMNENAQKYSTPSRNESDWDDNDEFIHRPNVVPKLNVVHSNHFERATGVIGSSIRNRGTAEYFADLIEKNIPGASIRCNVPLTELTTELPYTYVAIDVLVESFGRRLAIVLPPKQKYKTARYVYTMNACEAAGISAIRFMKEFDNEPDYVIGRIRSLL